MLGLWIQLLLKQTENEYIASLHQKVPGITWMKMSNLLNKEHIFLSEAGLTELEALSSFKMPLSISIVAAHFWSPAAKHRTAIHLAMEDSACLARPPDCDGLAAEIRESNKASKLVFADWTSEAKNL